MALIVFLAFASMATTDELDVKMLATGLGAGVLLDAVVVRSLLVPATVSWLGRWNWWMPEPAAAPPAAAAGAAPAGARAGLASSSTASGARCSRRSGGEA
jgi:putative drug exporter of the RND superfamily